MDIAGYVLLSQEQALRRRLDVVANNMANSSTVGFRREDPIFQTYVEKGATDTGPREAARTAYVLDYGTVHDLSPGTFQPTANRMDVMIDGSGYLAVEGIGGSTNYTRAGSIRILPTGELGTAAGDRLLGEGGQPILVPQEDMATVSIGKDGTVSTRIGPLGRISVTRFQNEGALTPLGSGLFAAGEGAGAEELGAEATHLLIGGVEGSNVQPIAETTRMIEILRSYQTSQRMTDSLTEMRQRAIDRLGRVN
jgi:flagellar basal-body rod protein FlgF